uniref:Feruloyl esterase n=1 Tax=Alexandrium catenella TaxID=2925 RepID=A0A7S1PSZ5_ALECA|mmetsp:Transcript_110387/g.293212  ORF Transcript_110387/g.293212 Transcript_110387/m.293212 type:complete len:269 (+) Transcript_110387:32-838(+)|eukprot:CAMPEP_0171240616 /NCGR_PEP_ID=MMETSP0790-20130122/44613_1 /TAXON_ID=2925 /ORGANISM="Alexandrium catenella, Strain OF101" /LENGTH=268 /DNA_ID=CAMNT_0011707083 /DNA_START=31 /DNA_END=837 /DNA_ORIENTATION=-
MHRSRSPRRGAASGMADCGELRGVDFAEAGVERRATFVDSAGGEHTVYVYLPYPPAQGTEGDRGLPVAVYIHSLGYESPLIESSRPSTYGMHTVMSQLAVVSPIIGLKDRDAYFDTEWGEGAIWWVSELIHTLATGLPDEHGMPRFDRDRIAVTGVSLGGGASYVLASSLGGILCCAAPVAAYHAPARREELAQGLARLPVYCVHSTSHTEKTCPIEEEEGLWDRIWKLGGDLHVERVQCKHGKTFSHAYEHSDALWQWVLQQRRASS